MSTVSIEGIYKSFGATAVLNGVSLDIRPGEFLSLVGPSGCGKSTLLRVIAGLERQDAGSIRIGERCVDPLRPKDRDVAMVFQSYALYPHMTVAQNIAIPLIMRKLSVWRRLPLFAHLLPGTRQELSRIGKQVEEVAGFLELTPLLERKPAQLSGGQRQRVALGRAMVRRPSVFLLDEPLSNLDAKLRVQTRSEIVQLHRRLRTTFICVTHDQTEAMTMSDRVAVMMNGNILQVGTPRQLYDDPDDLGVAEFIGSPKINVLPGTVRERAVLDVLGTAMPLPALQTETRPGAAVAVAVRAEHLTFAPSDGAGIPARVTQVEDLGAERIVHCRTLAGDLPVAVRSFERWCAASPGDLVGVVPAADGMLMFDRQGRRLRQRDESRRTGETVSRRLPQHRRAGTA